MKMLLKGALAVSLLLSCAAAPSPAQVAPKQRGITAEDYYAFEFLSDPRLSPDGRWVAYVVTNVDQRQNRRLSQIWLAAEDAGPPPRQFTTSPQSSSSPRWSPDGRTLAFLSTRPAPEVATSGTQGSATPTPTPAPSPTPISTAMPPGLPSALQTAAADATPRAQVWSLSLDGGEARRLTNLKNGVNSFDWSPDGTRMVLTTRTGPSDIKAPSSDVRHYKHTSYKFNDTGWFDDKRSMVLTTRTGPSDIKA